MTTPIIGEGDKIITTVLLNGERIHVRVHAHANGQNVFDAIIRHIGLNEVIYFGLMIIKDGEQQFLNLEDKLNKLAKYAPHLWKDDGSCNSSLVFTLFFRVKYYVENICLLQEQATRHQYYLQLRKDVLENSVRLHDDTSMVLASYALQAELGDYDKNIHGFDYFVPQHYLPAKTIAKLTIPYIKNALPAMHQSHRGLTEGQAEIEFLKEAQKLSEYGVLFHRVYKKEYNKKVPYNLGICVRGLVVYEETGPVRNPVCKHPWSKIKKMSFKRSKFIVEADSTSPHYSKMTLYTTNYKRSRYLLKMSSSFFNFQMMMASRLAMLPDYLPAEEPMHHPSSQSHQSMIPSVRIDPAQNMQDMMNSEDPTHNNMQNRTATSNTPHHPSVKETPKPKPKPKPEVKQYTLDLLKRDGSFGFSIVGGIELGGIFVKDVTPGGPAAISGLINAGDRIVQINKDSFENVTRREAIATLRNAPDKSRFIMETFGQNLVIEADTSIVTPLAMSAQSLAIMQPQVPVPQTDRESEFIRVDLPKKDNSFGIGFTGGPELGGVYIKSLLPGGSAETDGRIAIGDRLVEIDQTNVEGLTRKQIQELLKQSQGIAAIIIERYKQIPAAGGLMYIDREKVLKSSQNFTSITLHKKNDSLGFSITGGLDLGGIFVKYLNPNGPASMDGRLEVGDRVVAVNDISLETSTRQKALEIIRNATSPVNLIIEKCISPNQMDPSLVDQTGVAQMTRSDSIKSLPTSNRRPRVQGLNPQSRNLTYSMQHLPNANANIAHDVNYKDQRPMQQQRPPSLVSASQKKSVQDVFVVDLNKHNGSYGISLTGGHEVGGIYIKAVMPGGAAHADGRILKGDKVIEINARRMDGLSRQEAIDWLKSSGTMATFVLERFSQIQPRMNHQSNTNQPSSQFSSFDAEFLHVELTRRNNTFGLSLLGGPELRGIFIKNLLPGGPAASDGRMVKGDRLVEINAVSLEGLNRHQANDLLKQSGPTVNLLLEKIQNLTDIPTLDADLYSLELKKSESGFGFSITGGPELGGVYIKGILPGGAADASHKIMKGDRLVEVNGVSLDGLNKQQALDVIRKSPPVSNLLLERHGCYDNMILPESEYFTVELHKKYNGYGLSLTGGPEIDGVYVKQVQRDSSAYQDGRIKKGDRLVTINGRNVEACTKQKCTEMLKQSTDIAVIHFERCVVGDDLPPLDTVLTVVELTKGANGFGISLTGGPETGGIFVKALMPGGAAESDGRIFVGDRVAEMNSVSLEGYTRQQATDLLKTSTSAATFVLERYKQSSKSIASTRKLHMIHNPLSTESSRPNSPTSFKDQHNSFPFSLYNGAAPSVPPRHLNNGIPSRESAFKRLEQQQLKMAQQNSNTIATEQPPSNQTQSQTTYYQSGHHNIQGSPVSSRLPLFMQRQQSSEQNNNSQSVNSTQNNFVNVNNENGNQRPQYDQNNIEIGSLSLVDGPIRKFVDNNNTIEDSPQRFLQQFSRSVVSSQSNNNTTPSRIAPLGPVSSVIFGNNRDNRNVHELLDPGEKTLEETLIAMNETQRLEYLRINHPELLNEYRNRSILSSTNNGNIQAGNTNTPRDHDLANQRPIFNPRETVVCLSNGKPLTQTFNQQTPVDITTRPVIDPTAKFHQDQRHSINTNGQVNLTNQIGGISTPSQSVDRHSGLVKVLPDSFPNDIKSRSNSGDGTEMPKRQKSGGLQWVSLNDNGEGNFSNGTKKPLKKQEATTPTTPPHDRMKKQTSPLKQTNVPISAGRTTQSSSTGIPVPLASKFHPVSAEPKVKKTAFAGGDYVFEVNLSKGSLGLGMNLAGGGSEETPVSIKKIAPGTAADECGQLRVGDVILEINGKPVSHLPAKDVIGMLRSCPADVLLLVKRKTYETHYHVSSGTSSSYIGL